MTARYGRDGYGHRFMIWWCPGCDDAHSVPIEGPRAWGFAGPEDSPTLTPSVLIHSHKTFADDDKTIVDTPRCHIFLHSGQIKFLGDCTHALAGKTVPLPEWPRPDFIISGELK